MVIHLPSNGKIGVRGCRLLVFFSASPRHSPAGDAISKGENSLDIFGIPRFDSSFVQSFGVGGSDHAKGTASGQTRFSSGRNLWWPSVRLQNAHGILSLDRVLFREVH